MRADFRVVLDACVLANYGVANLLLLLAEKPRLYLPVLNYQATPKLKENAPPILYACSEPALLELGGLAMMGSRHVAEALEE